MEKWRNIPGFENHYEVSNHGRVRRSPAARRMAGKIVKPWPPGAYGHLKVGLYVARVRSVRWVHRVVLEAFVGACPKGHQCRHLNGDPADNRLENLAWGTPKENAADKYRHGTHQRGTDRPMSILTDDAIREIRRLHGVEKQADIAARFGVARTTVNSVQNGYSWRHVD
jgi:hypothetical protein